MKREKRWNFKLFGIVDNFRCWNFSTVAFCSLSGSFFSFARRRRCHPLPTSLLSAVNATLTRSQIYYSFTLFTFCFSFFFAYFLSLLSAFFFYMFKKISRNFSTSYSLEFLCSFHFVFSLFSTSRHSTGLFLRSSYKISFVVSFDLYRISPTAKCWTSSTFTSFFLIFLSIFASFVCWSCVLATEKPDSMLSYYVISRILRPKEKHIYTRSRVSSFSHFLFFFSRLIFVFFLFRLNVDAKTLCVIFLDYNRRWLTRPSIAWWETLNDSKGKVNRFWVNLTCNKLVWTKWASTRNHFRLQTAISGTL